MSREIVNHMAADDDALALTGDELVQLREARADVLSQMERVEFADGPLPELTRMLAESVFLDPGQEVSQLEGLQSLFYRLKDDMLDASSDEDVTKVLAHFFEEVCGDLTCAYDLAFEELRGSGEATLQLGTSLPLWAAYDRLASVGYVVSQSSDVALLRLEQLGSDELQRSFDLGLRRIDEKVAQTRELWGRARATVPSFASRAFKDTLASIGRGFDAYDPRLLAQGFPADIDYQLAHPVSEDLLGIDYVYEWLRRLCTENELLSRVDERVCRHILDATLPEWGEQVANLCEMVAWGLLRAAVDPVGMARSLGLSVEASAYLDGIVEDYLVRQPGSVSVS
jgi:hypothetical protein